VSSASRYTRCLTFPVNRMKGPDSTLKLCVTSRSCVPEMVGIDGIDGRLPPGGRSVAAAVSGRAPKASDAAATRASNASERIMIVLLCGCAAATAPVVYVSRRAL
jgi:hypothetical protein